jgi:hypothetical protein
LDWIEEKDSGPVIGRQEAGADDRTGRDTLSNVSRPLGNFQGAKKVSERAWT